MYDLTLNDVLISGVSLSSGSEGPSGVSFSLNYGKIGLVTTGTNASGASVVETFGWDLEGNVAIDPNTLDEAHNSGPVLVPEDLVYFIKIDGIAGDSTSKGHEGWFELSSQQFGFGRGISSPLGGDREASDPSFSEVTATLTGDAGLADLFSGLTSSKAISAVEIEGVSGGGSNPQTVYDLTLNDVLLSGVSSNSASGSQSGISFSLNYGKIGLITTGANASGASVVETFGWDLENNVSIDPLSLHEASNSGPVAVDEDLTYFIRFQGIPGDSTSKGHEGWFELSTYQLGAGRGISSLHGGDRTASDPSFSELSITLSGNYGLGELLGEVTNCKAISAVEIEGVKGSTGEVAVDFMFDDVFVSGVTFSGGGEGELFYSVNLNYAGIAIETIGSATDGTVVTREFSWDLAQTSLSSSIQLTAAMLAHEPVTRLGMFDLSPSSTAVFA